MSDVFDFMTEAPKSFVTRPEGCPVLLVGTEERRVYFEEFVKAGRDTVMLELQYGLTKLAGLVTSAWIKDTGTIVTNEEYRQLRVWLA